jgi:hypothetical protein
MTLADMAGPKHTVEELLAICERMSVHLDETLELKDPKKSAQACVAVNLKLVKIQRQRDAYYPDDDVILIAMQGVIQKLLLVLGLKP